MRVLPKMIPCVAAMICCMSGAPVSAQQATPLSLKFEVTAGGDRFVPAADQACAWQGKGPTRPGTYSLRIDISRKGMPVMIPDSVTLVATGEGAEERVLKTWRQGSTLVIGNLEITKDIKGLSFRDSLKKPICEVPLKLASTHAAPAPAPAPVPAGPTAEELFALQNEAAEAFFKAQTVSDHELVGSKVLRARKVTLYHLPDGSPAFPIPRHLTEKDEITLKVAHPADARVKVQVMACDDVPTLRVQGSLADASTFLPKGSAADPRQAKSQFRLKTHPKVLECSDSLSYKITTTLASGATSTRTITLAIDPIYHIAWGVAAVFDFGKRGSYSLKDRPVPGGGAATEKYIALEDDYSGMRPLVLLGVYPFGANPKDWGARDIFSLLIGVDPTHFTDGFVWGIGISPLPGVGIMGGMSIYSVQELDEKVVDNKGDPMEAGDTYKATGDLPTKTVFNSDSVGGFIGLTITSEAIKALMN